MDKKAPYTGERPAANLVEVGVIVPVTIVSAWNHYWTALSAALLMASVYAVVWQTLSACGFAAWGVTIDNCSRHPRLRTPQSTLAALEAEAEHLARQLQQAKAKVPPPAACTPGELPSQQGQAPAIDERTWRDRNVAALHGCWRLNSDYRVRNVKTQELHNAQRWRVCFDASGRGQQTLEFNEGIVCNAPITASFPSAGKLELQDQADLQCSNGFTVFRRITTCSQQTTAEVECMSTQPSQGDGRSKVGLKREL